MKHVQNHELIGISKAEFEALDWVMRELESGRIEDAPKFENVRAGFNMRMWQVHTWCGAVHCIGGWAQTRHETISLSKPETSELFAPFGGLSNAQLNSKRWASITPAQAVRALRNFLYESPGDPRWEQAVAG